MADEPKDLASFIAQNQMIILKRVTLSCYQDRMKGLLILRREHIERRRRRILPGEELCAVIYIEGDQLHVFHLENGHRLETSIEDFYSSMNRISQQMCNKKVIVLLVARPRIYD
ncbi:hypothetical protein C4544_01135 [candidate division WS5 bacterium]|uniref:Uncharacterized protein n=1 Tax=candidate division WS5 bacterium TaxID=2093353 RepID=A0A419DG23_9BACT|nr:MAG: hypothetical protein C4544_01135 [candidate division WS5 bacterium]